MLLSLSSLLSNFDPSSVSAEQEITDHSMRDLRFLISSIWYNRSNTRSFQLDFQLVGANTSHFTGFSLFFQI